LASFLLYQLLPLAFCLVMEAVKSMLYRWTNSTCWERHMYHTPYVIAQITKTEPRHLSFLYLLTGLDGSEGSPTAQKFGLLLALPVAPAFLSGNGNCKEHFKPTDQPHLLGKAYVQYTVGHHANHKNRAASSLFPVSSHWFGRREGSSFIFNPRSWKNKSPGGKEGGLPLWFVFH
jgi:hypothetical protein